VKIRVANTTGKPETIPLNTFLGPAVPVAVVSRDKEPCGFGEERTTSNSETFSDLVEPVLQNLPTDVSPNQEDQVVDFLHEFDDMFSRGTFDMGRTTSVEHTIDTGCHRPIRQPLLRHPRALLDEIDKWMIFFGTSSSNLP